MLGRIWHFSGANMIGRRLSDRYEIVSELGRGGMGVVYKGHDPLLDRDVAIKVISPGVLTSEIEQRFALEAKVVAQMDHPSIVSIFDFGHHEGSLFFVMPVLLGHGLHRLIRERSLRLGDILDIGIDVADALGYSHERGVIHRDVKPENIMVSRAEDGALRVRVMDFGLARRTRVTALTKTGVLVGTASYISPEQVTGQPVDGRSDIYSLGTVLYHCVTSDVPFTGELQSVVYRIVHEIPQSPRALGAEIDEEFEGIVLSCLSKTPEARPQTAKELKQLLQSYRSRVHSGARLKSVTMARSAHVERPPAPFVDRTEEIKQLQQRLNLAVAGECQFVVVSGEPGVGKTRLLEELETLARARRIRVLHGRFVEQDAAFPYHGFCETIQDYFRRKEASSAPSYPDFSDIGPDLIALFPMLREIEAIRSSSGENSLPVAPVEARSPESRHQIFELLARTLTRLAGGGPLLLLLEDLHGAELSLEALPYIVRRLGPTPTLIVGTYRSTEVDREHPLTLGLEGFRGDRRFASIALGPLAPSDHRRYLATLVGGSGVVDRLAERLYEASEGNPFFTKELLRSLLDTGGVVQDERGAWILSGETAISTDMLPATVQQAVETRIRHLPDELRNLLAIASVMGKSFDFHDLEKLAQERDDLEEAVDRLVKHGLIEEDRRSRGDRLAFSSGLVHDVLYAGLSRRKRRSLHRRYAEELEVRHAGRLERAYPQLVHHFYEGDVPEKAVQYGLLQARQSLESFAGEEAVRAARTALEFLDEDWEGDRGAEAEARLLLAAGHELSGDVAKSLEEFEAAIAAFLRERQVARAVETMLVTARAAWKARKTAVARRWVERGIEAAREAGADEVQGKLLTLAATLAALRGEHGLATDYLQAAERLVPAHDAQPAAEEIPRGGTLIVGLAAPIAAGEPAAIQLHEEAEVHSNVFETLVGTNENGILVPVLAASWEMRDEGRSFLFVLRTDVRFQDGKPLAAEDVKRSYERSIRRVVPNLAPAFAAIRGFADFAAGKTEELAGLVVHAGDRLEIELSEPLPIFPSLLSDPRAAVTRRVSSDPDAPLLGSGPFRWVSRDAERLVLERNQDYWRGDSAKVERIEFRLGMRASAIASCLRAGELDLARDLQPQDLDEILRDARWRGRVVELAQKTTYFILFNACSGPACRHEPLRQALSGVIRTRDLVWRTLGRFAQPATGYLPPGILGHDPGRRPGFLSTGEAQELLAAAGLTTPVRLHAAVHPLIADRYQQLLQQLFSVWSELGVAVEVRTPDMRSYLAAWEDPGDLDLWIGRWIPDYDDPDNFTHTLFHSRSGQLRGYYSSAESDRLLERARAEWQPAVREELYGEFERRCLASGILVPLFQDVDYRVTGPQVRGLRLTNTHPPVNYSELGKTATVTVEARAPRERGGAIHVPMTGRVEDLDPALSFTVEQEEVLPSIYETLTRDVGDARIVPWLAAEFTAEERGKRYRFKLRDDVAFHDGRRLTARDVRFSFERLLLSAQSKKRSHYAPIRGAKALLEGRSRDLEGFHIHSAGEFTIELERPVSFFPGLLAFAPASIVPEGTGRIGDSWKAGAVGTGPFRVAGFDPRRGLELERNPEHWRSGFPRSQGLSFSFAVSPEAILAGFRAGRFSLASDLFPTDVGALRRDPKFAAGYRETPRLSTYYTALNTRRGPLSDLGLRRKIVQAIDAPALVQATLRQVALPAHGLIPPGLVGHELAAEPARRAPAPTTLPAEITLVVAVHPVFTREYSAFFERFEAALRAIGVRLRPSVEAMGDLLATRRQGEVDLALVQWVADYPDANAFVDILQTDAGFVGPLCGSPELDELIERGRGETDTDARHRVYRRIDEMVMREARLIPLFHEQVYRFARPEVEGLKISYGSPAVAYEELQVREI